MTTTTRGESKNEAAPTADATPLNEVSRPSSQVVFEPDRIELGGNRESGLSGQQSIGTVNEVDHALWPLAPSTASSRHGKGAASPACAVCPGALNLLSQVGATSPMPYSSGARLPTVFLLAQDC